MSPPAARARNRTDYRLLLAVITAIIAVGVYLHRSSISSPSSLSPALSSLSPSSTLATMTAPAASSSKGAKKTAKDLSPAEFRRWNKLADGMQRFHDKFAWEFDNVYEMADGGWKKAKLSFPRFIREAEQVSHHLDLHHRIEEAYIFPMLAKKLPQFRAGGKGAKDHVDMHRKIHNGLKRYDEYLDKVTRDPDAYEGAELRKIMDSFRDILFNHLDLEVKDLGAESVYNAGFTLDELARFPL